MLKRIEDPNETNLIKNFITNNNFISPDIMVDWLDCTETEKKGKIERIYKVIPVKCANYIMKNGKYFFVKSEFSDDSSIYLYADNHYKEVSSNDFKSYIKMHIPEDLVSMREIQEIYLNVRTDSSRNHTYDELDNEHYLINFEDGIYDIKNKNFYSHEEYDNSKYLITTQIPAKYMEIMKTNDEPTVFHDYLNKLVDYDVESYDFLMEYMAVAISNLNGYMAKKVLFLVGKGNTGKSQLKKLAETLIGIKNVSSADLKDLNSRFGLTNVFQKRLVGSSDMSYQKIDEMNVLKALTGGDNVSIEIKGKASFNYVFKGLLWFNCNQMPMFGGDKGKWVYERFVPIYCKNVIPKSEQNPRLFEYMWNEKNAIIKELLEHLDNFINRNYLFEVPKSSIEFRKRYEVENSSLLMFLDEYFEIIDGKVPSEERIKTKTFKQLYYDWCDQNEMRKSKAKFKEIKEVMSEKEVLINKIHGVEKYTNLKPNEKAIVEFRAYFGG